MGGQSLRGKDHYLATALYSVQRMVGPTLKFYHLRKPTHTRSFNPHLFQLSTSLTQSSLTEKVRAPQGLPELDLGFGRNARSISIQSQLE